MFTDHAVLQRDKPIPVWGTADPGESIQVSLDTGVAVRTQASNEGRWLAQLPPLPAGGPYVLTIEGKNKVQFKDVLVGEVWICSGQSNMEVEAQKTATRRTRTSSRPPTRRSGYSPSPGRQRLTPLDKVTGEVEGMQPGDGTELLRRRLLLRPRSAEGARGAGRTNPHLLGRHAGRGVDEQGRAGRGAGACGIIRPNWRSGSRTTTQPKRRSDTRRL